jgi:phosphoglycerol transferase
MIVAAVVIVAAFTIFLIVAHLGLDSPILSGDEYAYFANSREFPNNAAVARYQPDVPAVNNILYLWIGNIFWNHFNNPLLAARIVQSVMYLAILFLLYAIARKFMRLSSSICVALLGFVSALSSYSAYFMPETTYFLIFYSFFAATVLLLDQPFLNSVVSGFLVALLMLTKPNGVAIAAAWMVGSVVYLMLPRLVTRSQSATRLALVLFPLSVYASLVVMGSLFRGQFSANPALFIGDFYSRVLSGQWQSPLNWFNLATVAVGNVTALCMLVGLPLAYALFFPFELRSQSRKSDIGIQDNLYRHLIYAWILLISVSAFAVAMTVIFTTQIGGSEIVRIHGRYYSFIVPIYLILMFATVTLFGASSRLQSIVIRAAALLGVAVALFALFYWRSKYVVNPYDFPELFALTDEPWSENASRVSIVILTTAVATFAACAAIPRRAPLIFAAFFVILGLASLIQTTRWQFYDNQCCGVAYREALAIRDLLPTSLDNGLVIGRNYNELSFVLFALRSRSQVVMLPSPSVLDKSILNAKANWVLLLGDYDSSLIHGHIALQTPSLKLIIREPQSPLDFIGDRENDSLFAQPNPN